MAAARNEIKYVLQNKEAEQRYTCRVTWDKPLRSLSEWLWRVHFRMGLAQFVVGSSNGGQAACKYSRSSTAEGEQEPRK